MFLKTHKGDIQTYGLEVLLEKHITELRERFNAMKDTVKDPTELILNSTMYLERKKGRVNPYGYTAILTRSSN